MSAQEVRPRLSYQAQYQAVLDARKKSFDDYFEIPEQAQQHQVAHLRLMDVERVLTAVSNRREYKLYEMAFQLLGDGLCQIACANYRLAFYCLRAFLKMSSAGVRYSAFEYELREWEAGRRDVSWAMLSGDESGCFSANFTNAFLPEVKEEARHYQGLARRVYRECSEYVHGNPSSHGPGAGLEMKRADDWFELYNSATAAIFFCFSVRYLKDFVVSGISEDVLAIIDAEIGHFASVRALIRG